MGQGAWQDEFPCLPGFRNVHLTDGNRTLISAIFDLQNQAVTVPQRAGFSNAVAERPV
jgi:hypothetical protein